MDPDLPRALITRVRLENYKSIRSCDVALRPLTMLVGPNGSGKSNFLDALRFVKQALLLGLDQAVRERGGITNIRSCAALPDSAPVAIDLRFHLASGAVGRYWFGLGVRPDAGFSLHREGLDLTPSDDPTAGVAYTVEPDGSLSTWHGFTLPAEFAPPRSQDRLFLMSLAGLPNVRPAYDMLASLAFYNPNPAAMKAPRPSESVHRLLADGANIATVLRSMRERAPDAMWRITQYLSAITPGIREVGVAAFNGHEMLDVEQEVGGDAGAWRPRPSQLSDGTLRALAVLAALFQGRMDGESAPSLVAIEEPETGLHPSTGGVLLDALGDASVTTQVLVTTHASSLLDSDDVDLDDVLAVESEGGVTRIGPIDRVGRSIVDDHVFTVGELLQMNQLRPGRDREQADGGSGARDVVAGRI